MVFRKEDQKIAVGSPVELSTKDYAEKLDEAGRRYDFEYTIHRQAIRQFSLCLVFPMQKQDMKTDIFMFISDLKEYLAAKSEMRAR